MWARFRDWVASLKSPRSARPLTRTDTEMSATGERPANNAFRTDTVMSSHSMPNDSYERDYEAPTGMYVTKRSSSIPQVLRRMRLHGMQDLEKLPEDEVKAGRSVPSDIVVRGKLYLPSRAKSVRCELWWVSGEGMPAAVVEVYVRGKCVLELDRRLLQFRENLERREIAFNAKEAREGGVERYQWWLVRVDKEDTREFLRLHREIAEDASF